MSHLKFSFQYKSTWDRHKEPTGDHGKLRLEVRKMCAEKDPEPIKPGRKIKVIYLTRPTYVRYDDYYSS